LTVSAYKKAHQQARVKVARLSLQGKAAIRRKYASIIQTVSTMLRKGWNQPFLQEAIKAAIPKQDLYTWLMDTVKEGREKAGRVVTDIDKQYILDALEKVPGTGIDPDKVSAMFDGIAHKNAIQDNAAIGLVEYNTPGVTLLTKKYKGWGWANPGTSAKTGKVDITQGTRTVDYTFKQAHTLSKSVWAATEDFESKVLNCVWGSRSQGLDPKKAINLLDQYLADGGGKRVLGAWGALKPGSKQYARRLGVQGVDYRSLRIWRTETNRQAREATVSGDDLNPGTTGLFWWRAEAGRQSWSCSCKEWSDGGPYTKDEINNMIETTHPNCSCLVEPDLKNEDDFIQQLQDYVQGNNTEGAQEIDQWAKANGLLDDGGISRIKEPGEVWKEPATQTKTPFQMPNDNISKAINAGIDTPEKAKNVGKMIIDATSNGDYLSTLSKYREFGGKQGMSFMPVMKADSSETKKYTTKMRDNLNSAKVFLPTDWIATLRKKPVKMIYSERGWFIQRTYKLDGKQFIEIQLSDYADPATALHELGHFIVSQNPKIRAMERQFWKDRTAGNKAQLLNDVVGSDPITGRPVYDTDEKTKVDNFNDPYMGKFYGKANNPSGFEIVSMGLESIFIKDYNLDSEYMQFMLGILAGL
jgi:hypothetical protein